MRGNCPSAASGLPVYSAHGGFKAFNLGMFLARDLNAVNREGRREYHGFHLNLGVIKQRDQALAALREFLAFLALHRGSNHGFHKALSGPPVIVVKKSCPFATQGALGNQFIDGPMQRIVGRHTHLFGACAK